MGVGGWKSSHPELLSKRRNRSRNRKRNFPSKSFVLDAASLMWKMTSMYQWEYTHTKEVYISLLLEVLHLKLQESVERSLVYQDSFIEITLGVIINTNK